VSLQAFLARAGNSSGHAVWPAMRSGEKPARAGKTCENRPRSNLSAAFLACPITRREILLPADPFLHRLASVIFCLLAREFRYPRPCAMPRCRHIQAHISQPCLLQSAPRTSYNISIRFHTPARLESLIVIGRTALCHLRPALLAFCVPLLHRAVTLHFAIGLCVFGANAFHENVAPEQWHVELPVRTDRRRLPVTSPPCTHPIPHRTGSGNGRDLLSIGISLGVVIIAHIPRPASLPCRYPQAEK
jgi:hypothetical protein